MFEGFFKGKKSAQEETVAVPLSISEEEMKQNAAEYAKKNGPASFSAKDVSGVEEILKAFGEKSVGVGENKAFKKANGGSVDGSPIDYVPVEKDERESA